MSWLGSGGGQGDPTDTPKARGDSHARPEAEAFPEPRLLLAGLTQM